MVLQAAVKNDIWHQGVLDAIVASLEKGGDRDRGSVLADGERKGN